MRGLYRAMLTGDSTELNDSMIRESVLYAVQRSIVCYNGECRKVLDIGDAVLFRAGVVGIGKATMTMCGQCYGDMVKGALDRNGETVNKGGRPGDRGWSTIGDVHDGRWFTKAGKRRAAFRDADLSDSSEIRNPVR